MSCGSILLIFHPCYPKPKPNKNTHVSKNSFLPDSCSTCHLPGLSPYHHPHRTQLYKSPLARLCLWNEIFASCLHCALWPLDMLNNSGPQVRLLCSGNPCLAARRAPQTQASCHPGSSKDQVWKFLFGFYSLLGLTRLSFFRGTSS